MDIVQTRMVIIAYLESAMEFSEQIEDGTTAYLIERALDETRGKQFSSIPSVQELH